MWSDSIRSIGRTHIRIEEALGSRKAGFVPVGTVPESLRPYFTMRLAFQVLAHEGMRADRVPLHLQIKALNAMIDVELKYIGIDLDPKQKYALCEGWKIYQVPVEHGEIPVELFWDGRLVFQSMPVEGPAKVAGLHVG